MLLLSYFTSYETNPKGFWGSVIFLSFGGGLMFLFISGITFTIYSKGNATYEVLKKNSLNTFILKDIDVSISNFNLYSSYNKSPSALFTNTIYDFKKTDLIISDSSIILLGRANSTGNMAYAVPVEITNRIKKTGLHFASIQSWQKKVDKLIIEISDHNYKKPIKIIFKSNIDEIENWCLRYLTYKY